MLGNIRIHTKGYDLAIETLRRAKAEGLPVRLRIAGLPVEADQLRALIAQHDLASMCEYVGPVYDPFEFLRTGHSSPNFCGGLVMYAAVSYHGCRAR